MGREIHLSQKSRKHGYWTSFESDPHLTKLKRRIRYRCTPCIESLYRQLIEGKNEIELGPAFDCWKVVVVLGNEEECLKVLEKYQEKFLPSRHICGRFGSKGKDGTKAIVVNADTEEERDALLSELRECVNDLNLTAQIFYSKGCAYLYGELLGDWHKWQRVTPVSHPENVEKVIKRIKEVLEIS
ncbi:MAG TPA: hypothetical protein ENG73_00340 [Desulfobacterales bacterium]|nr:hypothetical protein [Desulfobacterales bacterium]